MSGSVTVRKAVRRLAPRLAAAVSRRLSKTSRLADTAMTPLEGTSWYYLKRTLDPRARIEYAIARESTEDAALHLDPENPRIVEGFSRSYSELRMPAYAEAPELLEDPSVDAVSVVTMWDQHAAPTLAALEAGKHVFLEKPMASTMDDARAIVAAAEASGCEWFIIEQDSDFEVDPFDSARQSLAYLNGLASA